jgi:hypothetical protein
LEIFVDSSCIDFLSKAAQVWRAFVTIGTTYLDQGRHWSPWWAQTENNSKQKTLSGFHSERFVQGLGMTI